MDLKGGPALLVAQFLLNAVLLIIYIAGIRSWDLNYNWTTSWLVNSFASCDWMTSWLVSYVWCVPSGFCGLPMLGDCAWIGTFEV